MFQQLKKLNGILDRFDWRQLGMAMFLVSVTSILEIVGIFSILPFLQVIADPSVIESNGLLASAKANLGFDSNRSFIIFLGFSVLVIYTISSTTSVVANWWIYRSIWLISHRLGVRLLRRYSRLPFEFFHRNNSSELVKKAISDIQSLVVGVLLAGCLFIASSFRALLILASLFLVSPILALISFVVYGIAYLVMHLLRHRYLERLGHERVETTTLRFKYFSETLAGIKSLRVAGATEAFVDRFEDASERFAGIQPRFMLANLIPRQTIEFLAFGGIVSMVLYWLLSGVSLAGEIPVIGMFALATYKLLPSLGGAFSQAANLSHNLPVVDVVYEDIREDLSLLKPIEEFEFAEPMSFQTALSIDNVSYQYEASESNVLSGVSLTIPKGSRCALVGTTGCGKSTLMDVMVGLLFPSNGGFKVDDETVTPENVYSWQKILAYVPQEVFLYDDSIAANIALGVNEDQIDMDRVKTAAGVAQLRDFIESEASDGYNTLVGERGTRMSGGQCQRMGLARAFYLNPDVLFLDEATSALDNITEEALMSAIEKELTGVTVVTIAHRLSTVRLCDLIFLIEDGMVADCGSYEQLYEGNANFREMVNAGE